MKKYIKLVVLLLVFIVLGCASTIPYKVPDLIGESADAVDARSKVAMAEWDNAIATADAAKKLLELINSYISSMNQDVLSSNEKSSIQNFNKGYPIVMKKLDDVISKKGQPQRMVGEFEKITEAIKFANFYVSKIIDENSKIEAVINGITELTKKDKEDNR